MDMAPATMPARARAVLVLARTDMVVSFLMGRAVSVLRRPSSRRTMPHPPITIKYSRRGDVDTMPSRSRDLHLRRTVAVVMQPGLEQLHDVGNIGIIQCRHSLFGEVRLDAPVQQAPLRVDIDPVP